MNRIIRGQVDPVGFGGGTHRIDTQISALMPRLRTRRQLSTRLRPPSRYMEPHATVSSRSEDEKEKGIKARSPTIKQFSFANPSDAGLLELIEMISVTLGTKDKDINNLLNDNGNDKTRPMDGLIAQIIRDRREAELTLDAEIFNLEERIHLLEEDNVALAMRAEDLTHGKLAAERRADAMQKLVENIRAKNLDLNKERNYYETRMRQEKELSRQLLLQNEALRDGPHSPPKVDDADQKEREMREVSEVSEDETNDDGPCMQREACVVCRERCTHYESIPCDHLICTDCFVHWYASLMNYNDARYEGEPPALFSCPLCRTPIDVDGSCDVDVT